jgi:hypothetical protein
VSVVERKWEKVEIDALRMVEEELGRCESGVWAE